jgi:hypothetical protein
VENERMRKKKQVKNNFRMINKPETSNKNCELVLSTIRSECQRIWNIKRGLEKNDGFKMSQIVATDKATRKLGDNV